MDTGLDQPLHHVFINAPKKSPKTKKQNLLKNRETNLLV